MNEHRVELKIRLQEALDVREKKAADLVKNLKIPKSAISQYLSGKSQNMDSKRLYMMANYLDVNEAWLMGYDVPMERKKEQSKTNELSKDMQALIDFAKSVPEDKAELVLRVMKSIVEGEK